MVGTIFCNKKDFALNLKEKRIALRPVIPNLSNINNLTPNFQLPTPNFQLPTPNSQLQTSNSQLPTPNS